MKNFVKKTAHTALISLSHLALERFEPNIIGIGGVVGTALSREAIVSVLSGVRRMRAFKREPLSQDAFFSAILHLKSSVENAFLAVVAVPYALVRVFLGRKNRYPEVIILTYSDDTSGEVKDFLQIARPHIAVVTSLKNETFLVDEAKSGPLRLIESLTSSGYAILNIDDPEVLRARERTRRKVLTFGFDAEADMRIMNYGERDTENSVVGVFFKLHYGGSFVPIRLKGVQGKEFAYAAATAAAVGVIFGINLFQIAEVLSKTDLSRVS